MKNCHRHAARALCSVAGMLFAASAFAADADVTGLVPTVFMDFEASSLANKGSASASFKDEGTKKYSSGANGGYALDTSSFTPYTSSSGSFSTAGEPITVSAVMTLGTNTNGITLNVRSAAGDLIIRRGADAGSLVIGFGPQGAVSTAVLNATFADGDAAWHLVSVVAGSTGTGLYVDGVLVGSTTDTTLWSPTGVLSDMQFGSHFGGLKTGDVYHGGCIDDLRIHAAALTTGQMKAIAAECGLPVDSFISVRATGEPMVGRNSFATTWSLLLDSNGTADAVVVYGTDAAFSSPTTNALGSALAAGTYTASLTGLSSSTAYWWKIVASNGVDWAETPVSSFRTAAVLAETDFLKRILITVSGYTGESTLTNFPVLVKLSEGAPVGFDYADCAADGADIRFAAADGLVLPHEIESWDTNGTSYVWVRVPCIAGTTTQISLYYGADSSGLPVVTASDVWSRYAAVFHGGTAIVDATGNAASIVPGSVSSATTGGKAGGVMSKGSANGFKFSNPVTSGALTSIGNFSFSGWFKKSGGTTLVVLSNKGRQEWAYNGFLALVQPSDNGDYFSVGVGVGNSGAHQPAHPGNGKGKLVTGEWGHLAFGYDKSATQLDSYFNGTNIFSTVSARNILDPGKAVWSFGGFQDSADNSFQGDMDELRILNGTASADWIKAECDSVADSAAFAALSPARSTDADLPRFGNLSASDANGVATFLVPLAVSGYGGEVPTAVSVFFGTDGETWTELSLGSTNETATLTATASGFVPGVRYVWYAVATATSGGTPKTTTSKQRSFVAKAFDPTGYYKSFTATVVCDGESAENVPVPIRISEMGINGFSYDDVTASGFEILDAGSQLLPYEIDTWNTDGESILWTRLPVYENGATVTVRYGAPFANAPLPATNVWAGYAGVWHMNETYDGETAATGLSHDSSGNGLDATPTKGGSGNLAQMVSAPGVVGNARVNATSDTMNGNYLSVPNYDSLALGDTFAVSGWFKATIINGYPRLLSRKTAYNTDNGWELENGNGNAKAFSARGASGDAISLNTPSYDNAWVHIALVYNGTTLSAYANGSPCGSGTIAAATDNGKPLSIGNNSNGSERSFPGLYDEIRLLDATPSAAWIAAEYHAMADGGAISFSSVSSSDISAPVLGIPSVESNPDGSFTVSVEVSENTPASIVCIVGGTDYAMTTADASLPATYSVVIDDLPNGTHVATVRATATSETVVSSTCPTAFHVGSLTIVKQSDADEGALTPGVFRISRADADSTGLPALSFDVAFSGDGLAAIADPGISTATIPAGAAYVDIAVTPVPTDEVEEDAELVLTVSGAHVGQSSTALLTVVNATFDLAVRYVATDGNDANSGGTPESPKKTIAAAVAALGPIAPTRTCTVHVAPGLYPITSPIVVTNAIAILGDDPDPSRVVVSNRNSAGWAQTQRVFTINHAEALVANLTMQKGSVGGDWSEGANFFIESAGGTVSNCVVEAGTQKTNHGNGGGASLGAGLVTHTVFRKNTAPNSSPYSPGGGNRAAVLHLYGSSRAENCLLVDNPQSTAVVLVRLAESALMRNCTIVDSALSKTSDVCRAFSSIRIDGSNALVVNTVIAGVTNKIDGAACPPTGSVAKFQNGAFDGDVTGLPEGTVTGTAAEFFKDYENGDYTPSFSGPLANVGVEYEGMAAVDLAGKKRKAGKRIDIGCYECQKVKGFFIIVQ